MTATPPAAPPTQRAKVLGVGRWLLFAVVILAVPIVAMLRTAGPPPDLGQAPEFSLVDQAGRPFASSDLLGTITVLDFIFTRCESVCPRLTSQLAVLDERLPDAVDGIEVRLLSLSIDPEHDTPQVLAAYAADHGARLERWSFLSGPPDAVQATIEGFQQAAVAEDTDGDGKPDDFTHSLRFLVLDTRGRIRAMQPADDEGLAAIEELVAWLGRHPDG